MLPVTRPFSIGSQFTDTHTYGLFSRPFIRLLKYGHAHNRLHVFTGARFYIKL